MRQLFLWSLLALVPFTHLRMICFDHAGTGVVVQAEEPDCSAFCDRDQAPAREPAPEAGCLLLADGCSSLMTLVVTLCPPTPALDAPVAGLFTGSEPQQLYISPLLDLFSPPPRL